METVRGANAADHPQTVRIAPATLATAPRLWIKRPCRSRRPVDQAAFFAAALSSKNCSSSVEPFRAAVDASRSTVVVTASK